MYRKIEEELKISTNEASEMFPDSYILMRLESDDTLNRVGTALYIGDTHRELLPVRKALEDRTLCTIVEGLNHRRSLGGVIVGE